MKIFLIYLPFMVLSEVNLLNAQDKDSVVKEVNISESQLMKLIGEYDINWFASVVVTVENGKLISQVAGHGKEELRPESDLKFKNITKKNTYYEFVQDVNGKIIKLLIIQGSKTITADKDD